MFTRIATAGFLLLGFAAPVVLTGCAETTQPNTEAQAPKLPPVQTMSLDLSFFTAKNAPGIHDAAANKLNFINAVVRADFINRIVVDVLTPPALAFGAALNTIPSRDEDGSYLWIYTWVEGGKDHQIRLRGTENGDAVDWELAVVRPGEAAQVWITGQSQSSKDEGFWIFRDIDLAGDPEVLRVDWQEVSPTDATLLFTNIKTGDEEEGDLLRYRVDGTEGSIEFDDASTDETWDIIWDEADGSGSLRVPDYNNGERACWDVNQENTQCPVAAGDILAGGGLR